MQPTNLGSLPQFVMPGHSSLPCADYVNLSALPGIHVLTPAKQEDVDDRDIGERKRRRPSDGYGERKRRRPSDGYGERKRRRPSDGYGERKRRHPSHGPARP
jgi:hypothetical protein